MVLVANLRKLRVVPVVKSDDAAHAEPLARALLEGGLPCMEITFCTAVSLAAQA